MSEHGLKGPSNLKNLDPGALPDLPDRPDNLGQYVGVTGVEELDYLGTDPMDTVDAEPQTGDQEKRLAKAREFAGALGATALGRLESFADHARRYAGQAIAEARDFGREVKQDVQAAARTRAQRRFERDVRAQVGRTTQAHLKDAERAKRRRDHQARRENMASIEDRIRAVQPTKAKTLLVASKLGLAPTEEERKDTVIKQYHDRLQAAPGAPAGMRVTGMVDAAVDALRRGDTDQYRSLRDELQLRLAYNRDVAFTMDATDIKRFEDALTQETARAEADRAAQAKVEAEKAAKIEAIKAEKAGWVDPERILELKQTIEAEIESRKNDPDVVVVDNEELTNRNRAKLGSDIRDKRLAEHYGQSTKDLHADWKKGDGATDVRVSKSIQDHVDDMLNMSVSDLKQLVAEKRTSPMSRQTKEGDTKYDTIKNAEKNTQAYTWDAQTGTWVPQAEGPAREAAKAAAKAQKKAAQRPTTQVIAMPQQTPPTPPSSDSAANVVDMEEYRRMQQLLAERAQAQATAQRRNGADRYFGPGSSFATHGESLPNDAASIAAREQDRREEAQRRMRQRAAGIDPERGHKAARAAAIKRRERRLGLSA